MLGCMLCCLCLFLFGAVGAPVAMAVENATILGEGLAAVQHEMHAIDEMLHIVSD